MAIRPTDIQASIFQASQTAPVAARSEEGARLAQNAAQAQFAGEVRHRQETIAQTDRAEGNKVNADAERQGRQDAEQRERRNGGFEEVVDEAAGLGEPAHLIDFTA